MACGWQHRRAGAANPEGDLAICIGAAQAATCALASVCFWAERTRIANWTTKESGSPRQLRFMRWLGLRAPGWITDPAIWLISLVYTLRSHRPTARASTLYLTRLFGRPPGFAERHNHHRTFAHVFLDRVRFLARGVEGVRIDASRQHLIADLHAAGQGAVLLGAHFGSFEAMRAFDRELPGLTVRYLMYPEHAPAATALLNELNPEVAARVISLTDGTQAMLEVFEALERGEFIAFLGDRLPDSSVRAQVAVPFLGESIMVPTSPYIAAMAARVPLILSVAPRLKKGHYAVEFHQLYDGSPLSRKERSARISALAKDYALHLEAMCHRHPYNWFNFFDIWRK